jgi:hypothetical protein
MLADINLSQQILVYTHNIEFVWALVGSVLAYLVTRRLNCMLFIHRMYKLSSLFEGFLLNFIFTAFNPLKPSGNYMPQ